jgi:uncharacterized iron-regulated protein
MSKICLILCGLLIVAILSSNADQSYQIYNAHTGERVDVKQMANELQNYDVVFFGEFHGETILHELQYETLRYLHGNHEDIAVSMEMFERDVQAILDAYLHGEISEEEFLEESRPWSNYESDYRPLIEFARRNELDVIAANVPRRYAAMLHREGEEAVEGLSEAERKFIANDLVVLDDEYKERFYRTMQRSFGMMGDMPAEQLDQRIHAMYKAQCLKDDTMAESIYEYLEQNTDKRVIHFNGDFHSNSHLGTVQKLARMENDLNIGVITPLAVESADEFRFPSHASETGDFLIIYLPTPKDSQPDAEMKKEILKQ